MKKLDVIKPLNCLFTENDNLPPDNVNIIRLENLSLINDGEEYENYDNVHYKKNKNYDYNVMGPIPYMLELAAFISFGCQTWSVAVIVCMSILINGLINFTERLGSIASMVIININ